MDLDQLKDIWRELDEPISEKSGRQEISAMLKKRSQGPIAKMKRNLLAEMILVIVSYYAMITHYFVSFGEEFHPVAWFLLAIAALFLVYCYRKHRLLNDMQNVSGQVKLHLERQVHTLEKYVRFYLLSACALVPVCLAFFGWIYYEEVRDPSAQSLFYISDNNPMWKAVLSWGVLSVAFTGVVYFLTVWLLKKLYGNNIRKLKNIIREMSQE
jgi:4-hydroxybenzoate polyprenyltransferase